MIETAVFAALNAVAPSGGVWANEAPDSTPAPYVVFSRISATPQNDLDGAGTLSRVRIQVNAYAETYEDAKTLADTIAAAMAGAPFKNVPDISMDLFDRDVKMHYVVQDFLCWQTP